MEAEDKKGQTKRIFNPLTDDFTVLYGGDSFTIRARNMAEFSLEIADHVQKHLVTAILNEKTNPTELDRQKALEKTTV